MSAAWYLSVRRDEVQQQFPHGVLWVTIGEDTNGPELAEKVTNVMRLLGHQQPRLTDPVAAGAQLARVLGARRVLLVVDDMWTTAQAEPFLIGGPRAVRLFTSRIRGVLPRSAQLAMVDEMNRGRPTSYSEIVSEHPDLEPEDIPAALNYAAEALAAHYYPLRPPA